MAFLKGSLVPGAAGGEEVRDSANNVQRSYRFSAQVFGLMSLAAIAGSLLLFCTSFAESLVVAKLFDVANNLLSANLLLTFLFVVWPLRRGILVWAVVCGFLWSLQSVLPLVLVTR